MKHEESLPMSKHGKVVEDRKIIMLEGFAIGGWGAGRILLREIVSVVDSSPYFLSHNFTLPIFSARYVCNAVNETNVSALQSLQ